MTATPHENDIAWVSGTHVLHLSLDCPGLDQMRQFGRDPEQTFLQARYQHLADLRDARSPKSGKPTTLCRLCAVEPVALDILAQHPLQGADPGVFVTFTLDRPKTQDAPKSRRYRATDDGRRSALGEQTRQALHRIADAAGLPITRADRTQAAYGFLHRDAVEALARILLVEPKYTVTEMPDAELVSTFWSMRANTERTDHADGQPADPWYLAELVCLPTAPTAPADA